MWSQNYPLVKLPRETIVSSYYVNSQVFYKHSFILHCSYYRNIIL